MGGHQQRRAWMRGFVLLELLSVIMVIAILIALLLPAVQQAREAARITTCKNKLMQIGIALQNYRMAHRVFPPGSVNTQGPILNQPKGYHVSWVIQILPLLDEQPAYLSYDFAKSVYDPKNRVTANYVLESFRCPSSPSGGYNYAGCHNDLEKPIDVDNQGVLYLNSSIREKDLKDGRSYTIFVGEAIDGGVLSWTSGTSSTLRNMGTKINQVLFSPAAIKGIYTYGDVREYRFEKDSLSLETEENESINANSDLTTGSQKLTPGEQQALLRVGGFSSYHSEGAHFCFGDASVRYIGQKTDYEILKHLANRQDGSLIGEY